MQIKLFYKTYDAKLTLGAMKRFKEATGKDLWGSLVSFLVKFQECRDRKISTLETMKHLYAELEFSDASMLFYCVIKDQMPEMDLEQIQDAMFRCGWRPSEDESDMLEPWPMVMAQLAIDVDRYFMEESKQKKKEDTTLKA